MSGIEAVLVEPVWKLLTWIAPTWLYIQFVERQNPLVYLKLTNPRKGLLWGLCGCIAVVFLEFSTLLRVQTFHLSQSTDTWVNVILLVGLMEEIPFRGFLFQKLQSLFGVSISSTTPMTTEATETNDFSWGVVGAMLISSLLFVLIHLPLWMSTGQSVDFGSLLAVFIVAILACSALKLSDSLWSSVLIHTFYNFLITML